MAGDTPELRTRGDCPLYIPRFSLAEAKVLLAILLSAGVVNTPTAYFATWRLKLVVRSNNAFAKDGRRCITIHFFHPLYPISYNHS